MVPVEKREDESAGTEEEEKRELERTGAELDEEENLELVAEDPPRLKEERASTIAGPS